MEFGEVIDSDPLCKFDRRTIRSSDVYGFPTPIVLHDHFKFNRFSNIQCPKKSLPFDLRAMAEYVTTAVVASDESESFMRIESFTDTLEDGGSLSHGCTCKLAQN